MPPSSAFRFPAAAAPAERTVAWDQPRGVFVISWPRCPIATAPEDALGSARFQALLLDPGRPLRWQLTRFERRLLRLARLFGFVGANRVRRP